MSNRVFSYKEVLVVNNNNNKVSSYYYSFDNYSWEFPGCDRVSISKWEEVKEVKEFKPGELLLFKEGLRVVNKDLEVDDIDHLNLVFWDEEFDSRPIINRAKAGMDTLINRSYFVSEIAKRKDPTEYKAPIGYHDYNQYIRFFMHSKSSEWNGKRMATLQGSWLFHVTGSGAINEHDYNEDIKYPDIPVLCVTSGTDKHSTTLFVGRQIDKFVLLLLRQALFERAIKGEDTWDKSACFFEDWSKLREFTLDLAKY